MYESNGYKCLIFFQQLSSVKKRINQLVLVIGK